MLGVGYPFGLVRLSIKAWNIRNEMRYNDRYAAKGIPFGPGLDLGRCSSMLLVWSGVISHEVLGSFLV